MKIKSLILAALFSVGFVTAGAAQNNQLSQAPSLISGLTPLQMEQIYQSLGFITA